MVREAKGRRDDFDDGVSTERDREIQGKCSLFMIGSWLIRLHCVSLKMYVRF